MFSRNPALKEFLRAQGSNSLREIDPSFVNDDRFSALIAKQRALAFPEGRDFKGVVFDYENKPGFQVNLLPTFIQLYRRSRC
jgi:hypothetical protein